MKQRKKKATSSRLKNEQKQLEERAREIQDKLHDALLEIPKYSSPFRAAR